MRKILSYVLAVLLIAAMSVLFFSGCQKGGEAAAAEEEEETTTEEVAAAEEEEETTTAAEEEIKIGLDVKSLDNQVFVNVLESAREECDNRGWELIDVESANDIEGQQQLVDDLVIQGVDAIIMFATTDAESMAGVVQSAVDAGVPVIALDDSILGAEVSIYKAEPFNSGEIQAQYVVDNIGEEGMVCIICGLPGQTCALERVNGMMSILDEYPGIETEFKPGNWSTEDGMAIMEDFLVKYDKIDAVIGGNDLEVLGAIAAAEAAGRLDEILMVGNDSIPSAITSIKEGKMDATIYADSKEHGVVAIEVAEKILQGEDFPYGTKYVNDVREYDWGTERVIGLPIFLLTEDNVYDYFPD